MKNLENYVTSLEASKILYEEGITKKDSIFMYRKYSLSSEPIILLRPPSGLKLVGPAGKLEYEYPAFTLQELMELMPKQIEGRELHLTQAGGKSWARYGQKKEGRIPGRIGDNPLRALEALALYLIQNDLWN